jgi:hypothetical protein
MNLYPNYNYLQSYFKNNFDDYNDFLNVHIKKFNIDANLKIIDLKFNKYFILSDTYCLKKIIETDNFIIDIYLNLFDKKANTFYIHNYIIFPEYILYLLFDQIKNIIIDVNGEISLQLLLDKLQNITKKGLDILRLTKYIIINDDSNDNSDDTDIEDMIYLKNKLKETKFQLYELKCSNDITEKKINEQYRIINDLKLKNRKINFALMENQDLISQLQVDMNENINIKEEQIKEQQEQLKQQQEQIKQQQEQLKQQQEKINYYESSFIYRMFDGFYILFSRFHF